MPSSQIRKFACSHWRVRPTAPEDGKTAANVMIKISPIAVDVIDALFGSEPKNVRLPNSSWMGEISAYFQLEGLVQRDELVSLFRGFTPDGKVLIVSDVPGKTAPDGWHIQFTAPPTVRNLWVLAPEPEQEDIRISHESAAGYCLQSLERALRGPVNDRVATQIPSVAVAVVPADPTKQTVPELRSDAYLPNLHMPIHGRTERIPLPAESLERKAKALNSLYTEKLFGRLHWSLGLEFVREGRDEARLTGVPDSLDFTAEPSGRQPSRLARLFNGPLALKFRDWQSRALGRGWDQSDAKALLQFSRERKSIWSAFENSRLDRIERKQSEAEPPKQVTKTLFKTKTITHSY